MTQHSREQEMHGNTGDGQDGYDSKYPAYTGVLSFVGGLGLACFFRAILAEAVWRPAAAGRHSCGEITQTEEQPGEKNWPLRMPRTRGLGISWLVRFHPGLHS